MPFIKIYLQPLLLTFVIVSGLSACSANNKEQATTQTNEKNVTTNKKGQLIVESSHGKQVIEATVVEYQGATTDANTQQADFSDPLEFINRPIFAFNDVMYRYLLIPVSRGYQYIMPEPAQQGVSNAFANIREPLNAINNLAQGKFGETGTNVSRFLINSTLGLLGLFDPADAWFDINPQIAKVSDTLKSYNVGYGSYLVIPFLGQSDLRSGFSSIVESVASPIKLVSDDPQTGYLQIYQGFHSAAPRLVSYGDLRPELKDPYIFFRNFYMQTVLRDEQFEPAVNKLETRPNNQEKDQSKKIDEKTKKENNNE